MGYGDEFKAEPATGSGRGVARDYASYLKKGYVYDAEEGYLLSARGNPLTNVVRTGDSVLVHLASGKDILLNPLKKITENGLLSKEGQVAMVQVHEHLDRMECYTCHATWAPQCYGCHVKVDYSGGRQHPDWLAAASDHDRNGLTGGARGDLKKYIIDGNVSETRSYLRWEDPALSQNGEGRISPTIPGCQTTVTVIGKDGKAILQNHIFKIPNVEGAGEDGQLGIDMSPVQPHTIQKQARHCESCHDSDKALGYGIHGGKYLVDPSKDFMVDLMTADKELLPENVTMQKPGIKNLKMDWSRFVDENGKQLQTVGHHFKLAGPLDAATRSKLDRRGVCLSCHVTIPYKNLAVSLMSHAAKYPGVTIDREMHEGILHKLTLMGAWGQVLFGVFVFIGLIILAFRLKRKKWI